MKIIDILALGSLLLIIGCNPLLVNYTSDVSNPTRVKANIIVKFDDAKLSTDFQEPETRQSIVNAVRRDLQKSLFYAGEEEVDIFVKIEKLSYDNALWGVFWFPLWIVGAPAGRVTGESVVQIDIRSPKGQLLKSYRAESRQSTWYNTVYYNKESTVSSDGGIARNALKDAIEQIKYRIIEDRYSIVQLLENPQHDVNTPLTRTPVVPSSDVDFNIPKTSMHNPEAVAVVIGISDYLDPDVPRVEHAREDAYTMRQYLINVLGYDEKNILPRDPDLVMTAGAMKTLVRQQMPAYIKPGISDVYVYYSGHGAPNTTTQKAFFVPADCNPNFVNEDNGYLVNVFYDDLAKLSYRSLTVVLDACFSGLSGGGSMLIKNASPLFVTVENSLIAKEHTIFFTASRADQVSNWYPEKKHGLFTYFFLKGLQGEADQDKDGNITVTEMGQYLLNENNGVPYWSLREFQRPQTPQVLGSDTTRVLVRYAGP
jgi:hypothetical protein